MTGPEALFAERKQKVKTSLKMEFVELLSKVLMWLAGSGIEAGSKQIKEA